jgi:hypothetical protein
MWTARSSRGYVFLLIVVEIIDEKYIFHMLSKEAGQ